MLDHHTVPPVLPDANRARQSEVADGQRGRPLGTGDGRPRLPPRRPRCMRRRVEAFDDDARTSTWRRSARSATWRRSPTRTGGCCAPACRRSRGPARPGLRALMDVSRVDGGDDLGRRHRLQARTAPQRRRTHRAREARARTADDGRQRARTRAGRRSSTRLNRERQQRTAQAVALAARLLEDRRRPAAADHGRPSRTSRRASSVSSRRSWSTSTGVPAVVYEKGDEFSRASCRSIDDFHITDALRARPDLFVRFGGHRAAAGFTCETARLEEVREHLVAARDAANWPAANSRPILEIDAQPAAARTARRRDPLADAARSVRHRQPGADVPGPRRHGRGVASRRQRNKAPEAEAPRRRHRVAGHGVRPAATRSSNRASASTSSTRSKRVRTARSTSGSKTSAPPRPRRRARRRPLGSRIHRDRVAESERLDELGDRLTAAVVEARDRAAVHHNRDDLARGCQGSTPGKRAACHRRSRIDQASRTQPRTARRSRTTGAADLQRDRGGPRNRPPGQPERRFRPPRLRGTSGVRRYPRQPSRRQHRWRARTNAASRCHRHVRHR